MFSRSFANSEDSVSFFVVSVISGKSFSDRQVIVIVPTCSLFFVCNFESASSEHDIAGGFCNNLCGASLFL